MTIESSSGPGRPVALVTGVGRTVGIGAGIAARLAASGWDIAFTYWTAYDERMPWGVESKATAGIERSLSGHGAAVAAVEADLTDVDSPALVFDEAERIISLTSDATVGNLPYGASKAALDRITIAAARELADLGVTANAINPGPVDTGWMTDDLRQAVLRQTPLSRLGTPRDTAHLVEFLCSPEGGWINGQLLMSNGGFS